MIVFSANIGMDFVVTVYRDADGWSVHKNENHEFTNTKYLHGETTEAALIAEANAAYEAAKQAA